MRRQPILLPEKSFRRILLSLLLFLGPDSLPHPTLFIRHRPAGYPTTSNDATRWSRPGTGSGQGTESPLCFSQGGTGAKTGALRFAASCAVATMPPTRCHIVHAHSPSLDSSHSQPFRSTHHRYLSSPPYGWAWQHPRGPRPPVYPISTTALGRVAYRAWRSRLATSPLPRLWNLPSTRYQQILGDV
jgi:hypothetical protein